MNKVKFFYKYGTNIDIDTEKSVEVYIDEIIVTPVPVDEIRIVVLDEPLKSGLFDFVRDNCNCYTYLLTFHEELLNNNPNARLLHANTNPWIHNYVSPNKRFRVSVLVGGKDEPTMGGYKLRHDLWNNQHKINIPKDFYLSSHNKWRKVNYVGQNVLGDSKVPLFDSMFHVAIENTSIKDYFSEKILDCFQSRTVPIYWGCRNIMDYFNMDGILVVGSLDDIVRACNSLTPETYQRMISAMEDNFDRSCRWCDYIDRLKNAVTELIK